MAAKDRLERMRQKQARPIPAPARLPEPSRAANPVSGPGTPPGANQGPSQASPQTQSQPSPVSAGPLLSYEVQFRDGPKGCGCPGPFPNLRGEKPNARVSRLQKWKTKQCEQCRADVVHREREAARKRRLVQVPRERRPGQRVLVRFRLPPGAEFVCRFERRPGEDGVWRGKLLLATQAGQSVYMGESTSLHELVAILGQRWWREKHPDMPAMKAHGSIEVTEEQAVKLGSLSSTQLDELLSLVESPIPSPPSPGEAIHDATD